jgi:hypothetical protein
MLDFPVRAALKELQIASIGIEREPSPLAAGSRNLLVWITNAIEIEIPVLIGLIGQVLRLAGDGVDLSSGGANFVDKSLVCVAP